MTVEAARLTSTWRGRDPKTFGWRIERLWCWCRKRKVSRGVRGSRRFVQMDDECMMLVLVGAGRPMALALRTLFFPFAPALGDRHRKASFSCPGLWTLTLGDKRPHRRSRKPQRDTAAPLCRLVQVVYFVLYIFLAAVTTIQS